MKQAFRVRVKSAYHASAGTGKTHILLDCVFKFNQKGKPSVKFTEALRSIDETIFLSFSNAAVEEIKWRIYRYLQQCRNFSSRKLTMYPSPVKAYTIHSFALEVLRVFRFRLGFALPEELNLHMQEPTIWEQITAERAKQDKFVKENYALFKRYGNYLYFMMKLFLKYDKQPAPIEITDNEGKRLNPKDFFDRIWRMGENYIEHMFLTSKFDPDVPVFFMLHILKKLTIQEFFEELQGAYGWNIKRIIIDEAQDNDILQNLFLMMLIWKDCDDHQSLLPEIYIAGDYKQSIYMWRNAFPELYKDILSKITGLNKLKTLKTSFRIKNKKTIRAINHITEILAEELLNGIQQDNQHPWFNPAKDKLRAKKNLQKSRCEPIITAIRLRSSRISKREENTILHNTREMLRRLVGKDRVTIGILLRSRALLPKCKRIVESAIKELKKHNDKIHVATKMDMDIPLELISEAIRIEDKKITEYVSPFTLLCALAYEVYGLLEKEKIPIVHSEDLVYRILNRGRSSHFVVREFIKALGLNRSDKKHLNAKTFGEAFRRFWQRNIRYYTTGFLRLFLLLHRLNIDTNIESFWKIGILPSGKGSFVLLPIQEVVRPPNGSQEEYLKRILRHLMYRAVRVFEDLRVHYPVEHPDLRSITNYLIRIFYLPPIEAPSLLTEENNRGKNRPRLTVVYTTIHASMGKEYDGVLAIQTDDIERDNKVCEWDMEVRWEQLSSPKIWDNLVNIRLNVKLDASGKLYKRRRAIENFNLGYVAVTRTREHLIYASNLLKNEHESIQ